LTRLVEHVVADQWLAFAVATAGIALAMACALRDLRLAIIGLIPAILPNLVVLGVLGWSGTAVNLGAAMIAAVSMGLGVDSSLHYLIRYQREREHGRTLREALQVSQGETGLAVLMATLALVIGFASMGFSEFLPTVAFGTLAAWTMLGGLIGNLCVLPALVSWIAREK
jgi:predicted RND superfamily exporter protein